MAKRFTRARRALEVTRIARNRRLVRVLREIGVVGDRPATREGAVEFRVALEQLGTTYLKLGQLLSSRPDLLPDVYIEELGKLVDDVPPFPFAEVERIVQEDIGDDTIVKLEPEPLAAASIAQIHEALLADGRDVVIKVRRPGVVEQVDLDLDVIRSAVGFLDKRSETAQLLQLRALAEELEVHLRAELDFVEEASNTELIARQMADYDDLIVPKVIRPYVTERLLVLERIRGERVTADHGLPAEQAAR
ncbi:MAG: AarF/ABC1/UbiB kinase family protein, partial [Actinobacteria bacterium]